MELTKQVLERNRCKIHYWIGGIEGAPLVVFTHGATIDHHEWDATLQVTGSFFRVMSWDLRGHGLSRPGNFTLEDARLDLLAILDQINIKKAAFVGHSLGGNLHQELVFYNPERVSAMVIVDSTWNFQTLSVLDSLTLKMLTPFLKLFPYQKLVDQSAAMTATSEESRKMVRRAMNILTKEEFIQIMQAATQCLHAEPGYHIQKPLLLIVGDNDRTGNIRRVMPVWARQEPDCRLEIVPHALHAPNLDNPDLFHAILMTFLKEHMAG
jgi:pimeloyl-ACP methyl ester carboxylesterase